MPRTAMHGRTARSARWAFVAVGALLGLSACGAAPATQAERDAVEARMLAPFLAPREVGCDTLLVELTGNFDGFVARPAVDPKRHDFERVVGDGFVDLVWSNRMGAPEAAFVITVGQPAQLTEQGWKTGVGTRFRVVNQLRIRVFEGRHALTLRATAGTTYALVKEGPGKPRDLRQFVIPDDVPARP